MSLIDRLFHRTDPKTSMTPLYHAVVARGRAVHWYVEGAVPDTLDGRFDMIAAILSLVLIRLETADKPRESVWLTELFIDDMEGQLRQIGVGDVVVGKHVGRMVSALGGRLSAYREALAHDGDLATALARNLYRGEPVADAALADVETRLRAFFQALKATSPDQIIQGHLPS
ncbi:MAG: ubiquinol-cytochrome C chaperone [Sphingobium sp. 32-64-5]|nr:MAG: ubiquinol-cytochrome C chaperone [Sphingobium sp. 32-64-5]